MTCGLVCPKEPAEVKLVEGLEAVVPGCPLERIELTHHERRAVVIKPCKQAERGKDEVGVLIKMNLINNVLPALYPGVGEGGSRPDALKGNDVVAVNGTHCVIKNGVHFFVIDSSCNARLFNLAARLIEKIVHCNGGIALEALCNSRPQLCGESAVFFALLGLVIKVAAVKLAVVRSVALIAHCAVHIKNNIDSPL